MPFRTITRVIITQQLDEFGNVVQEFAPQTLPLDCFEIVSYRPTLTQDHPPVPALAPRQIHQIDVNSAQSKPRTIAKKKTEAVGRKPVNPHHPAMQKAMKDFQQIDIQTGLMVSMGMTPLQIAKKQSKPIQSVYTFLTAMARRNEARRLLSLEKTGDTKPEYRRNPDSEPIPIGDLNAVIADFNSSQTPVTESKENQEPIKSETK